MFILLPGVFVCRKPDKLYFEHHNMAKPSTKGLLKEISSGDLEQVYIHITNKAVEWVVAGFIDEANSLLEQLWNFKIPHSRHLWLSDEGLQVMWTVSGKRPSAIPFVCKDINEIEQENWSRFFYPCGDENSRLTILNTPFGELDDNQLFFKAINAGYANSEQPVDVLAALKRFIGTDNAAGYSYFHATSCAVLLAAKNNLSEKAEYFIDLWGQGYVKYWNNYTLASLLRDRKSAMLLLKGVLADVFKQTKETCHKETKEIIDALAKRMAGGRTLVYGTISWKQLLSSISKLAIEQNTIDFAAAILQRKTLCRKPAKNSKIKAVEEKLAVVLPDDYKTFLLASNGFENFSYTGVTLSSIDEVDFLINVDEQLVEIWSDSMEDIDNLYGEKLKSSVVIGGLQEEQYLLLVPLGNRKWECWHFANWRPGEVTYESFRFYIEEQLQRLEDNFYIN